MHYYARYGEGTGEILLNDVVCVGNETSLADCQHAELGDNYCSHYEDVSITCFESYGITGIRLMTLYRVRDHGEWTPKFVLHPLPQKRTSKDHFTSYDFTICIV